MQILKKVALATMVTVSSLSAHSLWVNSMESHEHKPGHTTVSLGWGHTMPIDTTLNSPKTRMVIKEFSITSPTKEKTLLDFPKTKIAEPTKTSKDFEVYKSEVALQQIDLKEDSTKGTYLIKAINKPTFYTRYIDTKDRKRLKLKSKDKIKDIKKILFSVQYETFATTYLTIGKWKEQKATGKGLEIIPKSDLSNVKVGDMVKFEVLFYGKPLDSLLKNVPANITANSNFFGEGKGFALISNIKNGIAQFEVQTKGQWKVGAHHQAKVTKQGVLKDLHGKVDSAHNGASLTFHVK